MQSEASECGLACLSYAASRLGFEHSVIWFRERLPASSTGMTLREIVAAAEMVGLIGRPVRCEPSELKLLSKPAILHWDMRHYVVLVDIVRSGVSIFDPSVGIVTVPMDEVGRRFTGVALELTPSPGFTKKRARSELHVRSLVRWSGEVKQWIAQSLLITAALQMVGLTLPIFLEIAVDDVTIRGDASLILVLGAAFCGLHLINWGGECLRLTVTQRLSLAINWDVTQRIFSHMVSLPLSWFDKRRTADVFTRFQSVDAVRNLLSNGLVTIVVDGISLVCTMAFVLLYSPLLAAINLGAMLLVAAVRASSIMSVRQLSIRNLQASITEQTKRLDNIRGIRTIKSLGLETDRIADWTVAFSDYVTASRRLAVRQGVIQSSQKLIDGLSQVATVAVGAYAIMNETMTVGVLFAFMSYRSQLFQKANSVIDQAMAWWLIEVYSFRLADVVLAPREADTGRFSYPDVSPNDEACVKDLTFSYPGDSRAILRHVDLTVRPGEMIAVVGPSGCGKSSLLKVMAGLYPPSHGEVLFAGRPLKTINRSAVRSFISLTTRDEYLFAGSIRDNIVGGSAETDSAALKRALEDAGVGTAVFDLPMRADTLVEDQGAVLSAGQRQRVCLARALYRSPRIILLDEALASVDVATEMEIMQGFRRRGMTCVLATHRPEIARLCDRVYTLKDGLLVPSDTNVG